MLSIVLRGTLCGREIRQVILLHVHVLHVGVYTCAVSVDCTENKALVLERGLKCVF